MREYSTKISVNLLYGFFAGFTGTNSNALFQVSYKYFAVTDFTRSPPGGFEYGVCSDVHEIVITCYIDTNFRDQVRRNLLATVKVCLGGLAPSGTPTDGYTIDFSLYQ